MPVKEVNMTKSMKVYTCDEHLTSPRPEEEPEMTISQMRQDFKVGDEITEKPEYKKCFSGKTLNGTIQGFKDPYTHRGSSTAFIALDCGCKSWLDVSWLELK